MLTHNWTLKDIRVGNVSAPPGAAPKDEPTAYHAPQLVRTLMDGPGNRSSITGCSCGGSFDGVYVSMNTSGTRAGCVIGMLAMQASRVVVLLLQ